jgi:chromosome segregation ATPase
MFFRKDATVRACNFENAWVVPYLVIYSLTVDFDRRSMLSFTDADIQRMGEYEEKNKVLRSKCKEQDDQRKQLLARIQCIEERLQQKARQRKSVSNQNDTSLRKQQEARLEAKIREQRRAKEMLERELAILKHAPHLVARHRTTMKQVLGVSPAKEKYLNSPPRHNIEGAISATESQDDLRRVVDALGKELNLAVAAMHRLKTDSESGLSSSNHLRTSMNPNHESVSVVKIQIHETGVEIKTIEDREEQTAIALKTVKENDYRLMSEVESLTSQLASQRASVATIQRQKQVCFLCSNVFFFFH